MLLGTFLAGVSRIPGGLTTAAILSLAGQSSITRDTIRLSGDAACQPALFTTSIEA